MRTLPLYLLLVVLPGCGAVRDFVEWNHQQPAHLTSLYAYPEDAGLKNWKFEVNFKIDLDKAPHTPPVPPSLGVTNLRSREREDRAEAYERLIPSQP